MRLTKFQKLFRSSKKNWDNSYYFCINLILISLPHAFGKKLFKNYQNFSEKSPKFQELFRQQSTRFLRNIYAWLLFKKLTIERIFLAIFSFAD